MARRLALIARRRSRRGAGRHARGRAPRRRRAGGVDLVAGCRCSTARRGGLPGPHAQGRRHATGWPCASRCSAHGGSGFTPVDGARARQVAQVAARGGGVRLQAGGAQPGRRRRSTACGWTSAGSTATARSLAQGAEEVGHLPPARRAPQPPGEVRGRLPHARTASDRYAIRVTNFGDASARACPRACRWTARWRPAATFARARGEELGEAHPARAGVHRTSCRRRWIRTA